MVWRIWSIFPLGCMREFTPKHLRRCLEFNGVEHQGVLTLLGYVREGILKHLRCGQAMWNTGP